MARRSSSGQVRHLPRIAPNSPTDTSGVSLKEFANWTTSDFRAIFSSSSAIALVNALCCRTHFNG
jgi:hypothetical protein